MKLFDFDWEAFHYDQHVQFLHDPITWSASISIPSFYAISLKSEDMDNAAFMVSLLTTFFSLSEEQAKASLHTHNKVLYAACGSFSKDVAESKIETIESYCKLYNPSIQCILERRTEDVIN